MVKVRTKIVFDIDDLAKDYARRIIEDSGMYEGDGGYDELLEDTSQLLIEFFDKAIMTGET